MYDDTLAKRPWRSHEPFPKEQILRIACSGCPQELIYSIKMRLPQGGRIFTSCSSSLKYSCLPAQASLLVTLLILISSSTKIIINGFCLRHLQSTDRTVSLRLGHLRGKTIINRFLTPSGRFATCCCSGCPQELITSVFACVSAQGNLA